MAELKEIEALAAEHADALAGLEQLVNAAEKGARDAVAPYLAGISAATLKVTTSEMALTAAIGASKDHFVKPKSRLFHGLRLGLRKQKGELRFEDAARVVALIRKHLADKFDLLVKTEETPRKGALSNLTVAQLKRIGVEVGNDTDVAFITVPNSDIRQHAEALLKAAQPEEPKGKKKDAKKERGK